MIANVMCRDVDANIRPLLCPSVMILMYSGHLSFSSHASFMPESLPAEPRGHEGALD